MAKSDSMGLGPIIAKKFGSQQEGMQPPMMQGMMNGMTQRPPIGPSQGFNPMMQAMGKQNVAGPQDVAPQGNGGFTGNSSPQMPGVGPSQQMMQQMMMKRRGNV